MTREWKRILFSAAFLPLWIAAVALAPAGLLTGLALGCGLPGLFAAMLLSGKIWPREPWAPSVVATESARQFQESVEAWALQTGHRHSWYPDGPKAPPPWRCSCGATKEHLP